MTTPNIVPQADGEGSLGTVSKQWLDVQAKTINGKSLVTTATADSIPLTGATGKLDASLLGSHSHAQSDITNLSTALAAKSDTTHNHSGTYVEPTRSVSAGAGLSGGGALSANQTISMGTPSSCSTATANSASGTTHTHTITGVATDTHTHSDYVPTTRTVTAGNGITGGGALSGNITVTLGTPGSCSTATTNSVTATSHTHAITGVAASSHTHSYAPIPTSSALPVGFACLCNHKYTGGTIANGATVAGSNLYIHSAGSTKTTGGNLSGTWKNIFGVTIPVAAANNYPIGLFVRIA